MNRSDVGGRPTPPHTLDALVSLGAAAFGKHEANLFSGSGILLLPEHRLAMCIIPKNGCTTLKWVAMVLLGHSPSSVCGCKSSSEWGCCTTLKWVEMVLLGHSPSSVCACKSSEWGCLGNRINDMHGGRFWHGSLQVHSKETLRSHMDAMRAAFTSPSWTAVAFVRDPVVRVRSAYQEDLRDKSHLASREGLLKYVKENVPARTTAHATHQSDYCGLGHGLKYDHYLDVDDGGLGEFNRILATTHPPFASTLLTTGWETCTEGRRASLVDAPALSTSHGNPVSNASSSAAKNALWEAKLITNTTLDSIFAEFKDDYRVLPRSYLKAMQNRLSAAKSAMP